MIGWDPFETEYQLEARIEELHSELEGTTPRSPPERRFLEVIPAAAQGQIVYFAGESGSEFVHGFQCCGNRYECTYRINTEFRLRIPAGLSCSSRWSAPRRALIKSWFKAARNFRAVWEPAERRVSHGLRSNSRMTPPWGIEHVAVRASPLMRLT